VFFALFVLAFTLNRYSPDSFLNGDNGISLFLFFGSFILFFLFILIASLHIYRKRREHYLELTKLNGSYILVLVWFFITIVGARTMVRLILVFSPTVVLLSSFALVFLYDLGMRQRHQVLRIVTVVAFLCLLLLPAIQGSLVSYYKSTSLTTLNSGPIYTQQWQYAMQWVRENTPTDAVFAHWWDYGYWVQTGGQRATVSDGGNSGGAGINFNSARHLLTTPDDTDALTYMKSRGATHVLIVSEDVGKYPAFSTIGSDLSNDRYSWIPAFRLDARNSQELRNQTIRVYTGSTALDQDFIFKDTLLPRGAAGIGGFLVPFTTVDDSQAIVAQPQAVVFYNNQRYDIPLRCLIVQGKKTEFPMNEGLDACLTIIPSVEGNNLNPLGAVLYLSPKTRNSFLARHYIYGEESPNFKVVYDDSASIPLMLYNGRIVGPHKIWEANIPPSIMVNETMRSSLLPDERLYYVVN
ncbi:MAG: STT3 domain-containing protein, partial [Candidatus Woesearchaeota archaeon]|nr:STT3 domain-containing protein [Candidatus Woesearchaeota archaeon]